MSSATWRHGARHVTFVDVRFDGLSDTAKFGLFSDEHIDNKFCEQDLLRSHLKRGLDEGWHGTIHNGDLYCAMQGKYDRRSDRSQLRPELQGNEYLDALVNYNAAFMQPFAEKIIVLGRGNHEVSILKYHETDLVERMVGALNQGANTNILSGGYSGWVFFRCKRGNQRQTLKLYRHHGYGGGAPVTKGVIQTARMANWLPDADIILTGHTHTEWVVTIPRQRVSTNGKIYYDEQMHVKIPGYLASMQDGFEGYPTERGFAPTTCGAGLLEIGIDGRNDSFKFVPEVTRLK